MKWIKIGKRLRWPTSLVIITIWLVINAYRTGPPPAVTNAPGQTSCATSPACHVDSFSVHPGFADITVMGGVPANGYKPGETLTLMPYTMSTGDSIIGFEAVAMLTNATAAGQVLITDSYRTQLVSHDGLQYVMHTAEGTDHPGMHDWMYEWIAPPKGSGDVTIYGAFVSANNDHTAGADKVYTDTLFLPEDLSAGLTLPVSGSWSVSQVFPNPVDQFLNLEIINLNREQLSVQILDIDGRVLLSESGQYTGLKSFDMARLKAGLKLISISNGNNSFTQAFVKY